MLRVAVTRPRERTGRTCDILRELGFIAAQRSLLQVEVERAALASAAGRLEGIDWLLFTSAEAVHALDNVRRLSGWQWPAGIRAACVGPATARAASEAGLTIGLMPGVYDGAALGAAVLQEPDLLRRRFLWPRAEAANTGLAETLRHAGAEVRDVVAYRTVPSECGMRRLARDLQAGSMGAVLFLSPSAVDAYATALGGESHGAIIGVIGRSTGERARSHGLPVHVQPGTHTIRALAESLRDYAGKHPNSGK